MAVKKTTKKKATKKATKKAAKKATKKVAAKGIEAKVYKSDGKESGKVSLPETIFGVGWNADLVHQVVLGMQANAREPWAHTKDRSEVSGGGRKPWRQKGTGRARAGHSRSPIWRGGGNIFGPTPHSYSYKPPKKVRRVALISALSMKLKEEKMIILRDFPMDEMPSTPTPPAAVPNQGTSDLMKIGKYLLIVIVVLVGLWLLLTFGLVAVALLGFFPGLATDAKMTQSASYWKGEARPFVIIEASLGNSSTGGALLLQNIDASGTYTINGVTLSNSLGAIVNTTNLTVGPGATQRVNFASTSAVKGTSASGSVYELDVSINYTSPNGIVSRQVGSKPLIGKFVD